jgi:hypothetical protein
MPPTATSRATAAILALIAWAALAVQLYLSITAGLEKGLSLPHILVNFLSFFTVLGNLLVALILTQTALTRTTQPALNLQTATTVYIAVVGLGYSLLLRHIWDPQGLQKLADILLHDTVPLLYVLYWFAFCRRRQPLPWPSALTWLIWPTIYLLYSMVRGALTDWYPYHFLDPNAFGYPRVVVVIAVFIVAFVALNLTAIALTRRSPSASSK